MSMADVELVIKIPKDEYNIAKYSQYGNINVDTVRKAIANGIPLPKGHGRLIDADAIITEATERMKYPSNYKYMECVIAHMNLAPTIIDADAESEGKE